jgi:hypothetical protein
VTTEFNAGFNAYVDGTDLHPATQSSEWQRGYDWAFIDHMKMEDSIRDASEAQSIAHFGSNACVDLDAAPHLHL